MAFIDVMINLLSLYRSSIKSNMFICSCVQLSSKIDNAFRRSSNCFDFWLSQSPLLKLWIIDPSRSSQSPSNLFKTFLLRLWPIRKKSTPSPKRSLIRSSFATAIYSHVFPIPSIPHRAPAVYSALNFCVCWFHGQKRPRNSRL